MPRNKVDVTSTCDDAWRLGARRLERWSIPGASLAATVAIHEWNFDAAAAVLATASRMEVLVRQAVSDALTELGHKRGNEHWSSSLPFEANERRTLSWAQRHVSHAGDGGSAHLIEEYLPLGFWLQLVSNRYHTRLWVPGLSNAFPNLAGYAASRRESLHEHLKQALRLRNLAAHLHPLHSFEAREILSPFHLVAAAIDPRAAAWLSRSSRVDAVWGWRPRGPLHEVPEQSDGAG